MGVMKELFDHGGKTQNGVLIDGVKKSDTDNEDENNNQGEGENNSGKPSLEKFLHPRLKPPGAYHKS